jgi:hypothetical protein
MTRLRARATTAGQKSNNEDTGQTTKSTDAEQTSPSNEEEIEPLRHKKLESGTESISPQPLNVTALVANFLDTNAFLLAKWRGRDFEQGQLIARMKIRYANNIPLRVNLVFNLLAFYPPFWTWLFLVSQHSAEFKRFVFWQVNIPQLLIGLTFYSYRLGLTLLGTGEYLLHLPAWIRNFLLMCSSSLTFWALSSSFYLISRFADDYIIPPRYACLITQTDASFERVFRQLVTIQWTFAALTLALLPMWIRGYRMCFDALGRPTPKLTVLEMASEIVFLGALSTLIVMELLVTRTFFSCRFSSLVFSFWFVLPFFSKWFNYKFPAMHHLCHAVPGLYKMTHAEHHICRSVHPVNSNHGIFENYFMGCDVLPLASASAFALPLAHTLAVLISIASGHTMFPFRALQTWHVAHHLVMADMYGAEPLDYDKKNSSFYRRYHRRLEQESFLIRHPSVLNYAPLGCSLVAIVSVHSLLGWGPVMEWSPTAEGGHGGIVIECEENLPGTTAAVAPLLHVQRLVESLWWDSVAHSQALLSSLAATAMEWIPAP